MGSSFSETDNGKKDSIHTYIKSTTSYNDKLEGGEYKQAFFRKCTKCGHVQIGRSWNGYESHGIDWFDAELLLSQDNSIVLSNGKTINWKWRIAHAKY